MEGMNDLVTVSELCKHGAMEAQKLRTERGMK